jgi:type IX secretion system PorP/SprF family membrane protein
MAAQPHFGSEQGNLHYRDYELLINPASIGAANRHLITLGLSKQWVGFDSPISESIQYQLPMTQGGLGAWIHNETFGPQQNTQLGAAYAHTLTLGNSHNLSFGLSLSLLMQNERRINNLYEPDDLFDKPTANQTGFNAGFGAYYFTDNYYAGFSIPQLLANDFTTDEGETKLENNFKFEQLQYYFTGGYHFKISEKISLTPSFLAELSQKTSFGYEGALTVAYNRRFEVGAGFGAHSRVQFDFGLAIAKWLSLRYQYAQYLSSDYNKSSAHFIAVRIHWGKKPKLQATPQ